MREKRHGRCGEKCRARDSKDKGKGIKDVLKDKGKRIRDKNNPMQRLGFWRFRFGFRVYHDADEYSLQLAGFFFDGGQSLFWNKSGFAEQFQPGDDIAARSNRSSRSNRSTATLCF